MHFSASLLCILGRFEKQLHRATPRGGTVQSPQTVHVKSPSFGAETVLGKRNLARTFSDSRETFYVSTLHSDPLAARQYTASEPSGAKNLQIFFGFSQKKRPPRQSSDKDSRALTYTIRIPSRSLTSFWEGPAIRGVTNGVEGHFPSLPVNPVFETIHVKRSGRRKLSPT